MPEQRNPRQKYNRPAPQAQAAEIAGRLVPRAVELEAAVLGALMLEKDTFTVVGEILKPEAFYDPRHRAVYEAIVSLGMAQEPIDMMTVTNRMNQLKTLDDVGGPAFIVSLTANVASAAHAEYHAKIVAQKYLARQLISFATTVENGAFDETNDVDDLLQEAERDLFEISQRNVKREAVQIDPIINQAITKMQDAGQKSSGLSGLSSGFKAIDGITSGWQNSDLIILAARPAMGKTAFALSMALNIALANNPVAIFTLEMSSLQLVNRFISSVCELPGDKIKSGNLTELEWTQVMHRIRRLQGAPIYIDDTSSLSVLELRTKARRLVREHDVKMIVVDYLQLMNASGMASREQEVSTISRSLKQLARELNIPIMALSQLNRKLEDRSNKDKRPQLSDLRESGAIEQDADIVCFIHRPEVYAHASTDQTDTRDIRGLAEFIIAKHRSGRTDSVDLRFTHRFARFEDWTDSIDSDGFGEQAAVDNAIAMSVDPAKAAADAAALDPHSAPGPNLNF